MKSLLRFGAFFMKGTFTSEFNENSFENHRKISGEIRSMGLTKYIYIEDAFNVNIINI
jgi:hypothetical protein